MKIQLALLLVVVLFVSLPSVVFAQPPLRALPSGETSKAASKPKTTGKSWEGPFLSIGGGVGYFYRERSGERSEGSRFDGTYSTVWIRERTSSTAIFPLELRLGIGLTNRFVLYAVGRSSFYAAASEWDPVALGAGFMVRLRQSLFSRSSYMLVDATLARNQEFFEITIGSGYDIVPSLALESTVGLSMVPDLPEAGIGVAVAFTLNYQLY